MRNLVVAVSLILLSLFTVNIASVKGETPKLVGSASALGPLSVIWTPYPGSFVITQGVGAVVMNVQGEVDGGPYIYYFTSVQVSVIVQADWTSSVGITYSLRAKVTVPLSMASRGTVTGDAHPDGTFIIYFTSFNGVLTVNGAKNPLEGTTKIWALTPAHSFQQATSNYLAVELDTSLYSFTIGGSQAAQTVGGIPLPQADQYSQSVQIIT